MDLSEIKLMIAVPAKPAHVAVAHEQAKIATINLLRNHGVPVWTLPVPDCAWIGHARTALMAKFMASYKAGGANRMLMIDNDVSWRAEDVLRLLAHDVPFVGAVQADRKRGTFLLGHRRQDGEVGPVKHSYDPTTQLITNAQRLSAAFQMFRPDCFERLMEVHPHLAAPRAAKWYLKNDEVAQPYFYGFWEQRIVDGDWPGEDHAFCDRLLEAGIPVLVDPWIELGHWVEVQLKGRLGDHCTFPEMPAEAAD